MVKNSMKLMFIMIKLGMLSLVAACLSCCSGHAPAGSNELKCCVMTVDGGYGYVVLHGADTLIYQPHIPALPGRRAFATPKDALQAGCLVCRRMAAGQPPTLSREDVERCLTDTGVYRDRHWPLSR